MVKRISGILILLLSLSTVANAQRRGQTTPQPQIRGTRTDTTIKGTTLEVYQVYQPELKPMVKPELSPSLPPVEREPVPQQYEVPQQTLYYSYRSLPLRPLALGKDTGTLPPQNYALLGGGNLSTIVAEAGISTLGGDNWNSVLHAKVASQEGNLNFQQHRSFTLDGVASLREADHIFSASVQAFHRVFGRYGYNQDAISYGHDQTRAPQSGYSISLGAQNEQPAIWGLYYQPKLSGGYFDGLPGNESNVNIILPVRKTIDSSLSIGLALNAHLAWMNVNQISYSNHILQLAPALDYREGVFAAHFGVSPTIGESGGIQFLPDITASVRVLDNTVAISGGWQAQLFQNTLQQLTFSNPFLISDSFSRRQHQRHEVFGAVNIALGNHMSVWGRAAWQSHNGLPLFITRPSGDGKDFIVTYDENVKALVWGGGIRYAIGDDFSISAEGSWYNFYKHSYDKVWGEPSVRLKGYASWRILDELLVTTYAEVLDRIWGRNTTGQAVQQRGVFDFGASGEYTFASRFSVFLRAENVLGRRNERWLGYPSFGFNIYGGLRFRF